MVQFWCRINSIRSSTDFMYLCTFTPTGEAEKEAEEFNKYVNPGENAIWDNRSFAIHGLHAYDSRIKDADDIDTVWNQFCEYINRHMGKSQRGVLVAWRGESWDMAWVYRLRQAPYSRHSLPNKLTFFMDPSKVIYNYKHANWIIVRLVKIRMPLARCGRISWRKRNLKMHMIQWLIVEHRWISCALKSSSHS